MSRHPRSVPLLGLIGAEFLSLLGNGVAAVAIPLLVLEFTGSPAVVGVAGAGGVAPIVLAAFVGGRIIDRFGAWRSSVVADGLSFLSVLALPLVFVAGGAPSPLAVFGLVALGALFDPTGVAARQTLVPRLTRLAGRPLAGVNSLRGALENGADFLGPLLGVGLINLIGAAGALVVNALTFLAGAAIFAATVPRTPPRRHPAPAGTRAGWRGARFIFRHPALRTLAVMGMAANVVVLPFLALLLPVLTVRAFGSAALLGVSLAAFGLGATAGALLFARLAAALPRSAIFYGGLIVTGAAVAFCGLTASRTALVAAVALAGGLLGASNPLEQTVMHEETPPAVAGQVFTTLTAIRFAAGPLGLLLAGLVAERVAVEAVLLAAGGALLAAAALGWLLTPLPAPGLPPADEDAP